MKWVNKSQGDVTLSSIGLLKDLGIDGALDGVLIGLSLADA